MDIRCERCFTEYELEDESVSEEGTNVQCTACSHTFVVRRPPPPAPRAVATPAPVTPAPSAEWLLETDKGQVHRFRELTSLHQWIVERKVTRTARISRTGHGWRRLEEIVELKPFFDVVDEADRARAAGVVPTPQVPPPPRESTPGPRNDNQRPAPAPRPAREEVETNGLPPARTAPASGPQRPPDDERADLNLQARTARASGPHPASPRSVAIARSARRTAEVATSVVRRRGHWSRLLVTLGVAGAVAYFGITHMPPADADLSTAALHLPRTIKDAALRPLRGSGSLVSAGAPAAAAVERPDGEHAPGTIAPPTGESPPAPATNAAPAPTPPPAPAATAAPAPTPPPPAEPAPTPAPARVTPPPATEHTPAPPPPPPSTKPPPAAEATAPPGRRPYAELVAEARRLQDRGGITRARRLYESALEQQPQGVEALTGMGFVQLDRNRFPSALGYFKRALTISNHAPALFGMAEAYRYAGEPARALDTYRRFLAAAPDDRDAPLARRQVRLLSGEVPSASSILQEAAH